MPSCRSSKGLTQRRSISGIAKRWHRFACLAACTLAAGAPAGAQEREAISPAALQAHLEFLANDLLEGREAGTRGYDIAALYVAGRFKAIGLEPAGGKGYLQAVPVRRSLLVPGSVSLTIGKGPGRKIFTDKDHVAAYPSDVEADQRISAKAVFAGGGIVAPRYLRDDYAGLDVKGKIVVVLGGPPAGLPAEAAAHLGSPSVQATTARKRGALGVLVIYTPALEKRFPFARLPAITRQARLSWVDPKVQDRPDSALGFIDETAAAALFEGAAKSYAIVRQRRPMRGFDLPHLIEFTRRATHSDAASPNVAGLLMGSDPKLREEVIVVTSHLDHVGIGEAVNGDAIYNGALDNASGIATMLEVARVMCASPPRRSVLFLAVTAEEKGLIGSDYYAHAPTLDRGRIAGVVNIDGVMALYDYTSVIGYGWESSTLSEALLRATRSMGLRITRDPDPSLSVFTRSDHYSFVKQGIPAVFLQMAEGSAPDGTPGLEVNRKWDDAHLHRPSDDLRHPIDYRVFAHFSELFRRFIHEAASMHERPRWYRGDFFGETFAPDAPKAPPPAAASPAGIGR